MGNDKKGSPPLTRGKAAGSRTLCKTPRITPAYAGKRGFGNGTKKSGEDHPRLRGEKGTRCGIGLAFLGSPPLTRGKVENLGPEAAGLRITPAYAGKSPYFPQRKQRSLDHPRLRGEKVLALAQSLLKQGSPPLTRGKDFTALGSGLWKRITPAYAGKRRAKALPISQAGDHPRLRGEKAAMDSGNSVIMGSPPLTRGKVEVKP